MIIWLFYCFYAQFKGILINVYTCWVPSMYLYLCKIEMKLFTKNTVRRCNLPYNIFNFHDAIVYLEPIYIYVLFSMATVNSFSAS